MKVTIQRLRRQLTDCRGLKRIELADCYITDMTPLMECPQLQYVDMSGNPISINPLSKVQVKME